MKYRKLRVENKIHKSDTQYDDEIDLRELFSVLLSGIRKIIAITTIFALASAIYAFSLPNQYKATTLLAPAQSGGSDLSGSLRQLNGLASLAGVSMGGAESTEAQIAQEIMQSWSFIEGFIAENNIAVEIYAVEGWNRESNELQISEDRYDLETKKWLIENETTNELGPPNSWKLYESFSERLTITEDSSSGLVTVSFEYYSPQVAKKLLDKFVSAINAHMQQRQIVKVANNINYLQAQIEKTSIAEMRDVFYSIIEEQLKNKMLAEASPDYVFEALSPSMVPEKTSQPKRLLILIVGTLIGGLLSMMLVLLTHFSRKIN